MKVVLLAGGFGTRISEETQLKPKPMVEIGGKPILWHIMKYYSSYGFDEFVICAGYRAEYIKNYFFNYFLINSNYKVDLFNNKLTILDPPSETWKVTVIDTGLHTMTGGRIKSIKRFIGPHRFFLTYGEGLAYVDLEKLLDLHENEGNLCTLTSVKKPSRFGILKLSNNNKVEQFNEKPIIDDDRISGGFFVCEPQVFDYIDNEKSVFETDVLPVLAQQSLLGSYQHDGFWQCMDSLRDKQYLEDLIQTENDPWRIW